MEQGETIILLLNTAVFLWYVSEPGKLSAKVLHGIQQADKVCYSENATMF